MGAIAEGGVRVLDRRRRSAGCWSATRSSSTRSRARAAELERASRAYRGDARRRRRRGPDGDRRRRRPRDRRHRARGGARAARRGAGAARPRRARSAPPRPVEALAARSTRSCASGARALLARSASGTTTSPRPPTRRCRAAGAGAARAAGRASRGAVARPRSAAVMRAGGDPAPAPRDDARRRPRVPERARGLVLFAHGSGSSRHSPRNRHVAARSTTPGWRRCCSTCSRPTRSVDRAQRRSTSRCSPTGWSPRRAGCASSPSSRALPVGYFGASTGAGAALVAAADARRPVRAVVSRGGRPDLAGAAPRATCARRRCSSSAATTRVVIELNRQALRTRCAPTRSSRSCPARRTCSRSPGALERVAAPRRRLVRPAPDDVVRSAGRTLVAERVVPSVLAAAPSRLSASTKRGGDTPSSCSMT